MVFNKIKMLLTGVIAATIITTNVFAAGNADDYISCHYTGEDQMVCEPAIQPPGASAAASSKPADVSAVSTTPPVKKSIDPKKINVNSQQFGLNGPLTLDAKYDPDLAYIFGLSYIQMLGDAGFKIRLEGGENQFRGNVTAGYSLTPKQQIKLTYEYLAQNLPFDFASGQVNEWVGQHAFGAAYQYLINYSLFRTFGVDASYVKANSKDLSSQVYYQNDDAYYNWRRIAGGTEKTANATLEMIPLANTLVKIGAGYSSISYDTQYEDQQKNTTVAYEAAVEHILTSKTKLATSIQHTAGSTDHTIQVSQILPKSLEASLKGQYSAGALGLDNSGSVTLSLSYPAPQQYTFSDTSALAMLKNWIETPVVSKQRVLAIKDEKSQLYVITADAIASQNIQTGGMIKAINTKDYFSFNPEMYSEVQYGVHAYKYNSQGVLDTTTDYANQLNLTVQSSGSYDATVYSRAAVPANMEGQYQINIPAFGYQNGLKAPISANTSFQLTVYSNQQPGPVWKGDSQLNGQITFNQVVDNPSQGGDQSNGIYLNSFLQGDYKQLTFSWSGQPMSNWKITHNGNDWYLSRALFPNGTISAADLGQTVNISLQATDGDSAPSKNTIHVTVLSSNSDSVSLVAGKALPSAGYYQENYQAAPLYQSSSPNAQSSVIYSQTKLPNGQFAPIVNDQFSSYQLTDAQDLGLIAQDGSDGSGIIKTPTANDYINSAGGVYTLKIQVNSKAASGQSLTAIGLDLQVSQVQAPVWVTTSGLNIPIDAINNTAQGILLESLLSPDSLTPTLIFKWSGNKPNYWKIVVGTDGKYYLMRDVYNGTVSALNNESVVITADNGTVQATAPLTVTVGSTSSASQVALLWSSKALPQAIVQTDYADVTPLYDPYLYTSIQIGQSTYPIVNDTLSGLKLLPGAPSWLSIKDSNNGTLFATAQPSQADSYPIQISAATLSSSSLLTTSGAKTLTVVNASPVPVWKSGAPFSTYLQFDAVNQPAPTEGTNPILLNSYLSNAPSGLNFSFSATPGDVTSGNFKIVQNQGQFYLRRNTSAEYQVDAGDIGQQVSLTIYALNGQGESASTGFTVNVKGDTASNIAYNLPTADFSKCRISAENEAKIYQSQPANVWPTIYQDLTDCAKAIETYAQVQGASYRVINNPVSLRLAPPQPVNWLFLPLDSSKLQILNPFPSTAPNTTVTMKLSGASPAAAGGVAALLNGGDMPVSVTNKVLVTALPNQTMTSLRTGAPYLNPTILVSPFTLNKGSYQYQGSDYDSDSNVLGMAICLNGQPPANWDFRNPGASNGCSKLLKGTAFQVNSTTTQATVVATLAQDISYGNGGQQVWFSKN